MKKYRLVIPEMINKKHAWVANALELESMTITDKFMFESGGSISSIESIPKEWLEEIKEPETFDEWFDNRFDEDWEETKGPFFREDLEECHDWTVANEKKKHEPKQSFEECLESSLYPGLLKTQPEFDWVYMGWKAALKNRGYDE